MKTYRQRRDGRVRRALRATVGNCPLCATTNAAIAADSDRATTFRCGECGLYFRMTSHQISNALKRWAEVTADDAEAFLCRTLAAELDRNRPPERRERTAPRTRNDAPEGPMKRSAIAPKTSQEPRR